MPNNKQQTKRLKNDEVKRQRNKADKSRMRSAVRGVLEAESKDAAVAATPQAMKFIDKAAKKNIIHEKAAARMKARMANHTSAK